MRFWLGIGVFAAVVLIAFALFVLHITGSPRATPVPTAPSYAAITDVSFTDSYSSKTGLHAIKGSGTVPTACTNLTASSTVTEGADASSSDSIRIDLSAPLDTHMCLELATPVSFSVSVKADRDAGVAIYANGTLATSTTP